MIRDSLVWRTVRVSVRAETPILFASPSDVLRFEVRTLPMTAPWVVTLCGSLHSAIGRELHRGNAPAEVRAWFESVNRPAGILLEAPQAPEPGVFGVALRSAGRNLPRATTPANVLAYDSGEEFTFGLVLVGEACRAEADVIRAVLAAGKEGIGGRLLGRRGHFALVGAVQEAEAPEPPCPIGPFVCRFITPLAEVERVPSYAELWKMARIRVLHHLDKAWGKGELRSMEYDRSADDEVATLAEESLWEQWLLHYDFFEPGPGPVVETGVIGEAVYSHCPPSHWPILWRAAKFGIGGRTSLGFGRLALSNGGVVTCR